MPNLSRIRRKPWGCIAGALLWMTAGFALFLLIFSYALPQDLSRETPVYSRLAAIAFFGRVLTFHLSLLLAGIAATALPLRRWRLCIVCGLAALIGQPSTQMFAVCRR